LYIESSLVPGNGGLIITGQLGDVMKESVRIALSLARKLCGDEYAEKFAKTIFTYMYQKVQYRKMVRVLE